MNTKEDSWGNYIWPASEDKLYVMYRSYIDGELTRLQTIQIFERSGMSIKTSANGISSFHKKIHDYFTRNDKYENNEDIRIYYKFLAEKTIEILGNKYISFISETSEVQSVNDITIKDGYKMNDKMFKDFKEYIALRNQHVIKNIVFGIIYSDLLKRKITEPKEIESFLKKNLNGVL